MKTTEILMSEHRVIERVVHALLAAADSLERGEKIDAETFEGAIEFIREFADGCHHRKEEQHLFPLLESKGIPREGGPIGVMLHEHELGRAAVRGMKASLAKAVEGDEEGGKRLVGYAREYGYLLLEHIRKEDHVLFRVSDGLLEPREDEDLVAEFEGDACEKAKHERLLGIAEALTHRWGVTAQSVASAGGPCGCCG